MPQEQKHPGKHIDIRIAPDQSAAYLDNHEIDPFSTHSFELPNAVSVRHVKIDKDPTTGEVTIKLSE